MDAQAVLVHPVALRLLSATTRQPRQIRQCLRGHDRQELPQCLLFKSLRSFHAHAIENRPGVS
jgi:hypothetical protein